MDQPPAFIFRVCVGNEPENFNEWLNIWKTNGNVVSPMSSAFFTGEKETDVFFGVSSNLETCGSNVWKLVASGFLSNDPWMSRWMLGSMVIGSTGYFTYL